MWYDINQTWTLTPREKKQIFSLQRRGFRGPPDLLPVELPRDVPVVEPRAPPVSSTSPCNVPAAEREPELDSMHL